MMKALFVLQFLILATTVNAQDKVVTPSAEEILVPAFKQAAKEKKNVIIIFHASWCSWCKKMDASMNDPLISKYFNDNYVTVHLTVLESANKKYLENAGAMELMQSYHGEKAGLPFFVILNKKRNVLADSYIKPEGTAFNATGSTNNTGCPASVEEVNYFKRMLAQTSKLKSDALELIVTAFRKNEH